MSLFRTSSKPTGTERSPEQLPAFRLGAQIGTFLLALEQGLANRMNKAQHRIGFQLRNGLLAVLGLIFLLYFIVLLTQ
jgi:hypothetical protein